MLSAKPAESGKLRNIYIYNAIATFILFHCTEHILFIIFQWIISILYHCAHWDLNHLPISLQMVPNTCMVCRTSEKLCI